jgi:mannose-6-phosphate isomerase
VLIKLVDASEFLSVQVHPSDAVCEMLGGEPKTETWLVLDATADAFAYVGLRAKVDRKEFADAVTAGEDISKFLVRVPVAVGDIIHIPAGQVHALGAGCLILEIQQNSETTYRIFDWNRHVEGKPRQLHIDEALASIDFGHGRSVLIDSSHKEVEHVTPWYIVRRLVLNGPRRLQDKDECAFVMPVNAPLVIAGYTIPQGSFALLSPAAPSASSLTAGTTVIAVGLGSSR